MGEGRTEERAVERLVLHAEAVEPATADLRLVLDLILDLLDLALDDVVRVGLLRRHAAHARDRDARLGEAAVCCEPSCGAARACERTRGGVGRETLTVGIRA